MPFPSLPPRKMETAMGNPQIVTLHDAAQGSRARVLVSQGFNCFEFETLVAGRKVRPVWAAEGHETGTHRPSGGGIPILFPFPCRIRGTELLWQGRAYPLEEGDGRGNAIHGFVYNRPWRVVAQSERQVTGEFQASVDDPSLLARWPSDFRITATYRLEGTSLVGSYELHNPGDEVLPFGFGTHPYFRIPPTSEGVADDCRLVVPVRRSWELENLTPTGRLLDLPEASRFQAGLPFSEAKFDNVFTGLVSHDGQIRSIVEDLRGGVRVVQQFGEAFRECVVYTPGSRDSVCMEPLTCVPDAFRLEPQGIDAGLRTLDPGQSLTLQVWITAEPLT